MAAWKTWLNSLPAPLGSAGDGQPLPIDDLREDLAASIVDCEGLACERLRLRIEAAGSADELWLMRGELFQAIAARHCQAVAASRINALLPAFRRWLPGRKLAKV